MHFCFHSVSKKLKEMIPKAYESQFEWDGIKKQKCANKILKKIKNNSLFVSKEGYKTKDIKKSAEEIAEKVLNDEMSLRQFKQICNFYIYKKNNNEVKSHEQNNTII